MIRKQRLAWLATLVLLAGPVACHKSTTGGSDAMSGGSGNSGGKQGAPGQQKQGGSAKGDLTEPADTTTGSANGAVAAQSDDGSPSAVSHTSTAMPGAPEATVPEGNTGNSQKPHDKQQPNPGTAASTASPQQ